MKLNQSDSREFLENERETSILDLLKVNRSFLLEDHDADFVNLEQFKTSVKYSKEDVLNIVIKIVNALDFLWKNKITYNNLCPEYIYISNDLSEIKLRGMRKSSTFTRDFKNQLRLIETNENIYFISPEQTGRMNCAIDYRSDVYCLGAIFYYLLKKETIFEKDHHFKIIHSHVAKKPKLKFNPEDPFEVVVEKIISKMLNKSAESRYQSANGILNDLNFVQNNLNGIDELLDFEIGKHDLIDKFLITDKIFGRKNEIEVILKSYQKVVYGNSRMVLVAGVSGVGKTALVNEVKKPISEHNGLFISGKFDQLNKKTPYSSIIPAINTCIDEVLISKTASDWKSEIESKLPNYLPIISSFFPRLSNLFGKPSLAELPTNTKESSNLLNYIFKVIIDSFKGNEKPLVIFLDDLQWVDNATTELLKYLLTDSTNKNLLIVCGYRSNEVGVTHPFKICIDEIISLGGLVEKIEVGNLSKSDICNIIQYTIARDDEVTSKVGSIILKKTEGNAFFVKEIFKSFYAKKLISYNSNLHHWDIDLQGIEQSEISENVLILLIQKLSELPADSLRFIQMSSVVGAKLDLEILMQAFGIEYLKSAGILKYFIENEYLVPLDSNYKYLDSLKNVYLNIPFKFSHDKIQQASYESISPDERCKLHKKIFELHYRKYQSDESSADLFELIFHLNNGEQKISITNEERFNLFYQAGVKAFKAGAYFTAMQYFENSHKLLSDNRWQENYERALSLATYLAESYYLCAKVEDAEKIFSVTLSKAQNISDLDKIYEIQMNFYTNQGRADEAINIAVKALKLYGIDFPEKATLANALPLLIKVKLLFAVKSNEDILNNNLLTDQKALAALKILSNVSPSCFIQSPESMLTNCLNCLVLTLKYGNTGVSSYAISLMGFVEAVALSNYKRAKELMVLATKLNQKLNAKDYEAKVIFAWNNFVQFYHDPIKDSIAWLQKGHEAGVASGDLNFASYCNYSIMCREIYLGQDLYLSYQKSVEYSSFADKISDKYIIPMMQIMRVFLGRLTNESHSLFHERDKDYSYEKIENELTHNDFQNRSWLYTFEMMFAFINNDYELALEFVKKSHAFIEKGTQKQIVYYEYYFMAALVIAYNKIIYPNKHFKEDRLFNVYYSELEKMSKIMDQNFRSRFYLLKAMKFWMKQEREEDVVYNFCLAVNFAEEDGMFIVLAFAHELKAAFYLSKGYQRLYKDEWLRSLNTYRRIGAILKVESMIKQSDEAKLSEIQSDHELKQIVEISNSIGAERNIDNLINKIVTIVVEYTNATHGCLINIDRQSTANFPTSVIEYVFNSSEAVVVDDFNSSPFKNDIYARDNKIKSMLALPIKRNDVVSFVLYLENSELTNIFSKEKLKILHFIGSQMGLSLDNALMFNDLEKKITERTEELSHALESKDNLVRILCHDLNNILQVIIGSVVALKRKDEDLDPKIKSLINNIFTYSNMQADLIEHVSQIEAAKTGKFKLNLQVYDLLPILNASLGVFTQKLADKNLTIEMQGNDFENKKIICDKVSAINNIFNNVISNAIKFSNPNSKILISLNETEEFIVISIKDNGIGMSEKIMTNLFSKSMPTSRPGTNGERGVGFGMPLMKTYIELMNGSVEVASVAYNQEVNNRDLSGTVFHLKFQKGIL